MKLSSGCFNPVFFCLADYNAHKIALTLWFSDHKMRKRAGNNSGLYVKKLVDKTR